MKTPKSFPQQIADAALAIARANHYLVGFDGFMAEGISFDDMSDAMRILVDRELRLKTRNAALAIEVLASYAMRVHKAQL